jgi:hypothetical protein
MATRDDLKRLLTEGAERGGFRLPDASIEAIAERLEAERPVKGTRRASLQKIAKDVVGDPRVIEAVDFSDLDTVLDELKPKK